jgi:hypothetical protein
MADTSGRGLKGINISVLDKSGKPTSLNTVYRFDGSYTLDKHSPGYYDVLYSYSTCSVTVHAIIVISDNDTEVSLHLYPCVGNWGNTL